MDRTMFNLTNESWEIIVEALASHSGRLRDDSRLPQTDPTFASHLRSRAEMVEDLGRHIDSALDADKE